MSVFAFPANVVGPGVAANAERTALHDITVGGTKGEKKEGNAQKAVVPEEAVKHNCDGDKTMDSTETEPKETSTAEPNASKWQHCCRTSNVLFQKAIHPSLQSPTRSVIFSEVVHSHSTLTRRRCVTIHPEYAHAAHQAHVSDTRAEDEPV